MRTLRRHLRVFVTAWLAFQVASLSALVPRDCCAAHRPGAMNSSPSCHEAAPAAAGHAGHHGMPQDDTERCSMRGGCDGPMAAFLAQLAQHGVLSDPFRFSLELSSAGVRRLIHEDLISRLVPPDSPPPRA